MPMFSVTIINESAAARAYSNDRSPRKGEAKRKIDVSASGSSFLNGPVQEQMVRAGFERNEWKVLEYSDARCDHLWRELVNGNAKCDKCGTYYVGLG